MSTKLTKKGELLKSLFTHYMGIKTVEKELVNPLYIEGDIRLDILHDSFWELYNSLFPEEKDLDDKNLDFLLRIVDDEMKYFDTDLLTKKDREKYEEKVTIGTVKLDSEEFSYIPTTEERTVLRHTKKLYEENKDKMISFSSVDDIIKFMEVKRYI